MFKVFSVLVAIGAAGLACQVAERLDALADAKEAELAKAKAAAEPAGETPAE